MNKKKAEEIVEDFDCSTSKTREENLELTRAEMFLEGYSQAVNELLVCDCHCWPSIKEMHDYCVALEDKLQELK